MYRRILERQARRQWRESGGVGPRVYDQPERAQAVGDPARGSGRVQAGHGEPETDEASSRTGSSDVRGMLPSLEQAHRWRAGWIQASCCPPPASQPSACPVARAVGPSAVSNAATLEAGEALGVRYGERFVGFVSIGTPTAVIEDRPRPPLDQVVTRWQP